MEAIPVNTSEKLRALPRQLVVTLQTGGAFFALANVICVAIFAYAYLSVKHTPRTLEVKGSAKKTIASDIIAWDCAITARDPDLTKAYEKIKADADRVAEFIRKSGVPDAEVTVSAIWTEKVYQREMMPPAPGTSDRPREPVVVQSSKIENYILTQRIGIESRDMKKVPEVARAVTNLMKDGVEVSSSAPQYLYSKLSELKIDMLGEATRDATTRATQIVSNANGALGKLVDARMGVMQINPKGSTSVSDTGNNDLTSLEKDVLAVVAVRFELD